MINGSADMHFNLLSYVWIFVEISFFAVINIFYIGCVLFICCVTISQLNPCIIIMKILYSKSNIDL